MPTTRGGIRPSKNPDFHEWRKKGGVTLEELSALSRTNKAQLSQHENGIELLTPERQAVVARILRAKMEQRRREINQILGSVRSDQREKRREVAV
jgi:transcriptional regulator with XRE-family HTH domain